MNGRGDLLHTSAEALVNPVNCVGKMGAGIAAQFKRAFPGNFEAYARACESGSVRPGVMFVHETGMLPNPRFIINFPTKRHWRDASRIGDIRAGLRTLVLEVKLREIQSIAIPALGCGLGGLAWADVRPCIENAFVDSGVLVLLFEPR